MTNNIMSFGIYGNKIVTKYIDSNDNLVLPEETFAIEWRDGGFMIRPEYDATHYIGMTYNPTSTSGITVGTDLVLTSANSNSTRVFNMLIK